MAVGNYTTDAIGVWAPTDSVFLAHAKESVKLGMVLEDPTIHEEPPTESGSAGMSWILMVFGILFCVIALKFKNNTKYLGAMVSDLTDVRVRHNAFDDTVKETSFLILLNVMWVFCVGVLLWKTLQVTLPANSPINLSSESNEGFGIALCLGVVAIYTLGMNLAYFVVGNVFTDSMRTSLWVKGSAASHGLEVLLLFPIALVAISYEPWVEKLLYMALIVFILGKIVFIYKGFRIFFNQSSSWMLFLYYLCSLELVPLILAYISAVQICCYMLK